MLGRARRRSDFVNIYAYGDQVKVVYLSRPVRVAGVEEDWRVEQDCDIPAEDLLLDDLPEGDEVLRFESSIARTRARVKELALCNPWELFVTLTIDGGKFNRYNLGGFRESLTQWVRNCRRAHGLDIQYLLIPEQHKNGGWHMHGLLRGLTLDMLRRFSADERLPVPLLRQLEAGETVFEIPALTRKFGWTTASPIKSIERCSSYISKYISKDLSITADVLGACKHLYYASRGLAERKLLYSGDIGNASAINWGYANEYCKILWTTKESLAELGLPGGELDDL